MKYRYLVSFQWSKTVDMSEDDEKVVEFTRLFLKDFQPPKESGNCCMVVRIDKKIKDLNDVNELIDLIEKDNKCDDVFIYGLTLLDTQED